MEGSLLTQITEALNLDIYIILIVLLSGFAQHRFLPYRLFKWFTDKSFDSAIKTLVISTLVGSAYVFLLFAYGGIELNYAKLFISYVTATSVYEIVFRPFKKYLQRKAKKYEDDDSDL